MGRRIERFDTLLAFCDCVSSFLEVREAVHNVLIGVCSGVPAGDPVFAQDLVAVLDGDRVVGAAMRPAGGRLLLSDGSDRAAMSQLAAAIGDPVLPGVVGPMPGVEVFARAYARGRGLREVRAIAERVMVLEAVAPVPAVRGTIRRAQPEDRTTLVAWSRNFVDDVGDDVDDRTIGEIVDAALAAVPPRRFVWEVDGTAVSMAATAGPTPNGIRINWVYTPPEHRRHGYATALVAALSQAQLDLGRRMCFLFTDAANATSNHIYETIGYRPVGDAALFRFEAHPELSAPLGRVPYAETTRRRCARPGHGS